MNGRLVGTVAMCLAVAACGTTRQDRVGGGAAAGAATGAGIGALGGPVGVLAGGAIGAGAGAATGAATSPSDVNLGRPPWSDPEVRTPFDDGRRGGTGRRIAGGSGSATAGAPGTWEVRQAQEALAAGGFDPGAPDGVMGPQTRSAVTEFQRSNNLPATGRLDARTTQALHAGGTAGGRTAAGETGGMRGTVGGWSGTATGSAGTGSGTAGTAGGGVASTPGGTGAPGRAGATGTGSAIGPSTGGGGIGPAPGSSLPGMPSGAGGGGIAPR